jgi:NAD(P)-dependent dehydrogenase (short-subunit alcohol dehydrogenase family)
MNGVSGRAALVTGSTGNLGRVVVRSLLDRGAHVALAVRDEAKGEALRADLGADDRVLVGALDLTDRSAFEALVEKVMRAWGRLDILANLAGGFATGPATDLAGLRALWDQNVATAVTAAGACLRPMRARGYGRIVSVGAIAGLKGGRNAAGYAMAKGALVRWTESLAAEVKGEGITVNCVLPSTIDNPANRAAMPKADPTTWASPAEVAATILFLCSEEASGITGAAIPITART